MLPEITLRVGELREELKELAEADAEHAIPPPPPPAVAEAASEAEAKHPHPDIKEERAAKCLAVPAPALPHFLDRMDDGIEAEEKKEEGGHDVKREIDNWFSPAAPRLRFADNPPDVTWPSIAPTFPHLALLAVAFFVSFPPQLHLNVCGQDSVT